MQAPTEPTAPSTFFSEQLAKDTVARLASAPSPASGHAGASEELHRAVEDAVASVHRPVSDLALALHAAPETAFEEHAAARRIVDLLAAEGIVATLGVHGLATAVRAEFTAGRGGRTVAIMAEYDALPEIGHACGHNVICASGVGAFLSLHRVVREQPGAFDGRVVLLGTPGEEGHTGKEYMARAGALEGVDAALMLHPYGYDLADQVWLGRRTLRVTFTGRTAHASAEPFMGRNALDAATLFYQGIGLMRQQMIPVDRVHAIITEGGTRASIIPETAVVDLYVRSKYAQTLVDLSRRIQDMAHGAALMAGVGVHIDWDQHPPSLPVRTNGPLTERWATAQGRRGRASMPLGVVSETLAASTDFGNVSFRVPGIHPLLKIADENVALHTRAFADAAASDIALQGIADGAYGLAATALDFLVDEELARAVWDDFLAAGGPTDVEHLFDDLT